MKSLVVISLLVSSISSYADDSLRYGVYHSSATSLWKGADSKETNYGDNGKTEFVTHSLDYYKTFSDTMSMEFGLKYQSSEMLRGGEGGSVAGDRRSGLSELSTKFKFKDYYLGFSHPINKGSSGEYDESPDVFIAPNDGAIHSFIGVQNSKLFLSRFIMSYDLRLSFRSEGLAEQVDASVNFLYGVNSRLFLGFGLNGRTTLGGNDIGSFAFMKAVQERSNGNSKVKAFSTVKEEVFGASLVGAYQINSKIVLDGYFNRKISGRNTDISSSMGVGITFKNLSFGR